MQLTSHASFRPVIGVVSSGGRLPRNTLTANQRVPGRTATLRHTASDAQRSSAYSEPGWAAGSRPAALIPRQAAGGGHALTLLRSRGRRQTTPGTSIFPANPGELPEIGLRWRSRRKKGGGGASGGVRRTHTRARAPVRELRAGGYHARQLGGVSLSVAWCGMRGARRPAPRPQKPPSAGCRAPPPTRPADKIQGNYNRLSVFMTRRLEPRSADGLGDNVHQ